MSTGRTRTTTVGRRELPPHRREGAQGGDGLKALQEGRESEYEGKQLGYGPNSYDLRDAAQIKVPVFDEYKSNGWPLGPSHRMTYREFEPLPRVEGDRVVTDPADRPYRPRSPASDSGVSRAVRSGSCTG